MPSGPGPSFDSGAVPSLALSHGGGVHAFRMGRFAQEKGKIESPFIVDSHWLGHSFKETSGSHIFLKMSGGYPDSNHICRSPAFPLLIVMAFARYIYFRSFRPAFLLHGVGVGGARGQRGRKGRKG